jgi:predicted enzyme related to lactoylglutathione lyase
MRIKYTTIYVDDQQKALQFFTDVLGFQAKSDFSNHGYRWLTVVSPEEPDGTELQLALNSDPAAKAFQEAQFASEQPAANFLTDNVQADYDRMVANGADFAMPPTDVTASIIAQVKDGCGNLIQLTQLTWQG